MTARWVTVLCVLAACGDGAIGDIADGGARDGAPVVDPGDAAPRDGARADGGLDAGPACEEALTTPAGATADHSFRHHRPHYGARAHGHGSCSLYWSNALPDFGYSSSWGAGCHETRRYLLESSITSRAGWAEAAEAAFANWDIPTLCTPHWVRTTDAARADVIVRADDTSRCAGPGLGWYACAWSSWSITLNTAQPLGVGVVDRLDVESLITVELAHVLHFAHSPDAADSVSLANMGRWGSRTMSVPEADSCGFTPYTASVPGGGGYEACPPVAEGGCGNFRTLRPGDFALAEHLAGRNPTPPHAYDDGSVPPDAMHHDLAMLFGGPATSTSILFSWSGGADAFALRGEGARWSALGFPVDRAGPRLTATDVDADGRDDLVTAMPRCEGGARFHVWRSTGDAFAYGGDAGALDLDGIDLAAVAGRFAGGDFDGDGAGDVALFEQRGGGAAIRIVRGSSGGAGLADAGDWWAVDVGYDLGQVGDRFVAGDLDADGDDDLIAAYQYPDGRFHAHVWISDGSALAYAGPDGWYISGPFSLSRVDGRMVAGDFDRDGRADFATFYGTGGMSILHAFVNRGGSFVHQADPWTTDTGYSLESVGDRMVARDFDRDGRDDVATAYQYPDGTFRIHVWRSTGTGFVYDGPDGWYQSGPFNLAQVGARFVAGRFD